MKAPATNSTPRCSWIANAIGRVDLVAGLTLWFAAGGLLLIQSGCALVGAFGAMAQNAEYQKEIIVPAEYTNLAGKTVAVLVDTDMVMMYEHPLLPGRVAQGVAENIQRNVPEAKVLPPEASMRWQFTTPSWNLMAYEDIAKDLRVDRLVIVDIYEYRLHPPGNRYEWEGVAAGVVRIIEADEESFDPNLPAGEFDVIAQFPPDRGVLEDGASEASVEAGLLIKFVQQVVWLFYEHKEPKYPDKFRPELKR